MPGRASATDVAQLTLFKKPVPVFHSLYKPRYAGVHETVKDVLAAFVRLYDTGSLQHA